MAFEETLKRYSSIEGSKQKSWKTETRDQEKLGKRLPTGPTSSS